MYNPSIYNTNPYMNYGNYYNQQPMQPIQQVQPMQQNVYRPTNVELQGKQVSSLEVVKATDIPLDGSISYFPLADGSLIATKQLQVDGTSKITIYKPINEEAKIVEQPKYVTQEDLNAQISNLNSEDIKDIKEEIKNLNKQIENALSKIKDKKEK